jgi:hypothetical protein
MDPAAQAALLIQLQEQVQALQAATSAAAFAANEAAAAEAVAAEAAAAAEADNGHPVPGAPHTPVFTLAPALANTSNFINLTSANGIKYFKGATEPLTKTPFDFADPSDLQVFLDLSLKKSQVWGWNPIFTVPVVSVPTGETANYSLLEKYGLIPLSSVRNHGMAYYATHTKRAQDSFMACQSILSSLTLDFLKLITADSDNYHLPAIVAEDGPVPSGPLLLKMVISQVHVDSRATVSFIRMPLTKLDEKMTELDSNVEAFNVYVKAQLKNLSARGETSNDVLVNLFKGYKVANDVEFLDFIRRKENEYEEGHDVNANILISDTTTKYKARTMNHKWAAPTKEQGQILALTAQIERLQSARKPDKSKQHQRASRTMPKRDSDAPKDNKWAWKDILPKEGEPTTKTFVGKNYHVDRKFHPKQWVCHTSEECSKNPANADGNEPTSNKKRLKAAKLSAAILEEEDGDDSAEDPEIEH